MQRTSNIVSLHKDRPSEVKQNAPGEHRSEDNRTEVREISGEPLFVQITQSSEKELIGKTMACKAVDASAHGIKFLAKDFIPVGCLLDLWVDDKSRPGKFFLSGDVRWTQKEGKISTMVGVRLQDGLATDIESWMDVHSF
jgi:hypothetical protein